MTTTVAPSPPPTPLPMDSMNKFSTPAPSRLGSMNRRFGGKRSRTGCRTCRARRVKCDETPGACRRCTSAGRVCDGYEVQRLPLMRDPWTKISPELRSGFQWVITSDESRCFSYFQHHTVPTFREMFDSSLWQHLVLQIGQSEPAVYHATVALSAIHQDAESRGMPLAANFPGRSQGPWLRFAQEQLGRAFQSFTRRRASSDPWLRNVTLLCCLLFVLSDLLQGDYDDAFTHLQSGLRILCELQAARELVAPTPRQELVEHCLVAAFAQLDMSTAHYGLGGPLLCIDSLPTQWQSQPTSAVAFANLEEARTAFNLVTSAGYRFMISGEEILLGDIKRNYATIQSTQLRVRSLASRFWRSFEPFYHNSYHLLNHKEQRSVELIHLQYLGLMVSLETIPLADNPAALAAVTPAIEKVVSLAESIMTRFPERPTISIDVGVLPPLYNGALVCQDYRVRWRAIKLLRAWPHREGPFDSNWILALAEEALRLDLLADPAVSLDRDTAPSPSDDDEFAPGRMLQDLNDRRSRIKQSLAKTREGLDDGGSPADYLGAVKCVSGWSCMRAFRARFPDC
ncbi:transcriptional regulator family: Fungal Specific TF [Aspergillus niger]|nr:transcriptional regulator family: Fungal Specific TF [Aspergillus niger]KAI3054157.1 transcriptional regulator family: Fungal Specific TF [Aspergillus niger]